MRAFQPANPEVRKKKESRDILTAPKVFDIFFFFLPSRAGSIRVGNILNKQNAKD